MQKHNHDDVAPLLFCLKTTIVSTLNITFFG